MSEDPAYIQNRAPYAHLAGPIIQNLALTLLAPLLAALVPIILFGAFSGDWSLDPAKLHSPAAVGVFRATELAIGVGIVFGILAEDGLGMLPPCLISAGICLAGVSAYGGPAWTLDGMCTLALIAAIGLVRAVFAVLPHPTGAATSGAPATTVHPWLWALCAPLFVWGVLHGFPNAIPDLSILFLAALYLIARTVQPVKLVQPRELLLMPFFSPSEAVARHNLLRGIRPQRKKRAKPARSPRIDVTQPGTPSPGPTQNGPTQNQNPADERHIQPFRPASDAELKEVQSLVAPRPPRSNFSRVVGMDALKNQLREAADDIRSGWDAAGGGMERKNGILLHGEPGNGKSFIAEALAGELGLAFFKLTLGDVTSRWINQTTEQILAVFRQARETPNSMLFIDEIDALLPDRGNSNHSYLENRNLVNSFLLQAEEIRYTQTILVGATNYIDHLDPAAIREGRFDYKIMIPPPDLAARRALIARTAAYARRPVTLPRDDLDLLLDATEGLSATRLLALAREVGEQIRKGRIVGAPAAPTGGAGATGALIRFPCPAELLTSLSSGGAAATQPKTVATVYRDFSNALNQIRGQMGLVLPENTPALSGVMLADPLRASLESVVWRMTHARETFSRGGTLPTGMVFYGPPGTGKTLAARAIAKECEWNFLPVSGSEIVRGQGGVAGFISKVRAARPVIAFIDEADDILARRDAYGNPALNELLQALDGSSGRIKNALFIAATNRIEAIDPAALRGGRFAEKFLFDLPDAKLMDQFVRHWIGSSRAQFGAEIPSILAVLGGLSYASAEAVLQAAVNRAAVRSAGTPEGSPVSLEDLERSRLEV